MAKKLLAAYLVFSAVVLLAIIAWFAIRIARTRSANGLALEATMEEIGSRFVATILSDGGYATQWSESVGNWFGGDDSLKALVVYDEKQVEYLYAVSTSYVMAREGEDGARVSPPVYHYDSIRERLFEQTVVVPESAPRRVAVVGEVLARSDLVPVFREVLIALLGFLLITAIFMVVLPSRLRQSNGGIAREREQAMKVSDRSAANPEQVSLAESTNAPEKEQGTGLEVMSVDLGPTPSAAGSATHPVDRAAETALATPETLADPTDGVEPIASRSDTAATAGESVPPKRRDAAAERSLYSPESDLGWEDYLAERLNTELKRAASFDQDLVLFVFAVEGVYRGGSDFRRFAGIVREFFTFRDLCFEYGPGGIAVIVPNIDLAEGIDRCEEFVGGFKRATEKRDAGANRVRSGLSGRNGRLMSGERLIREASRALQNAREQKAEIIAFRVDPEKYRAYISAKG